MLGPDIVDERLVARLVERSAGNPFYLEELIRAVAEGRGDALPETIIALAQARLEDLDADARRIVRAASVFGVAFWSAGVAALLRGQSDERAVDASLSDLAAREFITARGESRLAGQREFAFRHGLFREAAYAMLTDADRVLGHRLAGTWLKAARENDALALAEHFERGEEPSVAATHYAVAAEQALGGNDLAAVLERARRGIECGASGPTLGLLYRLQGEAHAWRGELAEAEQRGDDAMRHLPVGSPRWCEAAGVTVTAALKLGHVDLMTAIGEELRALLAYGNVSGPRLIAISRASTALLHAGVQDTAMALIMRLEQAAQSTIAREPAVAARIHTARAARCLFEGDPGAYLTTTLQAVAEFERAGDRHNVRLQLGNAGHAAVQLGAYARAEEYFREALASAQRAGVIRVDSLKHNFGMALALLGRVAEGYAMETEAAESSRVHGDLRFESASLGYLSRIALLGGDTVRAEMHAREAERVGSGFPSMRAYALTGLAMALVDSGRFVEALEAVRDALKHFDAAGVEEGEIMARLAHAEALRGMGRIDASCEAIEIARDRVLDLAARISDGAWRASFLERVPENARTLALAHEWLAESDA
jgi:tetratricopeptide (TPR) repeat protein